MSNSKPIEYKGVIYPSFKVLAKAHGVKPNTLRQRLRQGMTLEEGLEKPVRKQHYVYEYKGVKYESLEAVANAVNIKTNTLWRRIKIQGLTLEEAIETPLSRPIKELTFRGVKYPSLNALIEDYGIAYNTINSKLNAGLTIDQAMAEIVHDKTDGIEISYKGITYKSIAALARAYEVKPYALIYYLDKGWLIDEAMDYLLTKDQCFKRDYEQF